MPSRMDTLIDESRTVMARLDELAATDDFDPGADEVRGLQKRQEEIGTQVEALQKISDQRAKFSSLTDRLATPPAKPEVSGDIGEMVVRSDAYAAYRQNGGGRAHLMSYPLQLRAVLDTSFLPTVPDQVVAAPPRLQAPLLGVLNRQQVSSGTVEVVYYPADAPDAGIVPEGTLKPEAALTTTVNTHTLDTLAHWLEATRQLLEDDARARDFISNSLLRGVYDKAEAEAAVAIDAATYVTVYNTDLLAGIREGIAQCQNAGYTPNAVLINPTDAAKLDMAIWSGGSMGVPSIGGSVWGVPLVPVGAITAGTAFVGDFNAGAQFFYRGAADLYISDSDVGIDGVSNFKRNIISFLAEMRAKTVITRPEAIVEVVEGTAPAASSNKSK